MELAKGAERTIDGIANGREIVLGHPKTREAMRAGLAMYFVTLDDAGADGARERDRRRARDRALLQHPARRRARDRDQPADLDDRLPGRPEPARTSASSARSARSPTTSCAPCAAGSARAERRCATSTSSSGTRERAARCPPSLAPTHPRGTNIGRCRQDVLRRRLRAKFVTSSERLRVTHCPVNVAGIPWDERPGAAAQGRRRAPRRLRARPAPPRGRLVARPARRRSRAGSRPSSPRSAACSRRPTSSTSTSGSRSCRSRSSSRSCARRGKKSVFHFLGSDIRGKTPAELAYGKRADARDRRLLRRDPLGARGARRPAGARPAPVRAAPAVGRAAAARRPRAVEPREEGHRARDRGLRAAAGRARHRRRRPARARPASATRAPTSSSTS